METLPLALTPPPPYLHLSCSICKSFAHPHNEGGKDSSPGHHFIILPVSSGTSAQHLPLCKPTSKPSLFFTANLLKQELAASPSSSLSSQSLFQSRHSGFLLNMPWPLSLSETMPPLDNSMKLFFCPGFTWCVYRMWDWFSSWKLAFLWVLRQYPEVSLLPFGILYLFQVRILPAIPYISCFTDTFIISSWNLLSQIRLIRWFPDLYSQLRLCI